MLAPKKLAQEVVGDAAAAVYTASHYTLITHLVAPNLDASPATLQLWQGATAVDATCILAATTLPAGGRIEGGGIVLEPGDILYAASGTDAVITLTAYGFEFTQQHDIPPSAFGFRVFDSAGRESVVYASTVAALDDIGDVALTTPSDGDALTYDDGSSEWVNTALALNNLSDATVTTPADGDILVYDTSAFVNKTLEQAEIARWLGVGTGTVTDPPTTEELTSELGAPATTGPGLGIVTGTTAVYGAQTDGTDWWYWEITAAQSGV